MKIPTIDLKALASEGALKTDAKELKQNPLLLKIGEQIRDALNQVGFFYFVNHGIPQDVIDHNFANGKTFFNLAQEVKNAYKKDSSKEKITDIRNYFGYNQDGTEKLHPTEATWETRQSYDCLEQYGRYPNDEIPGFQTAFLELFHHSKILVKIILRLLAISLEFEDVDFFLHLSKHLDNPVDYNGLENIRINYYPPILNGVPSGSTRAAEHSDYDIMTFLFQDEGGLAVQTVHGEWVNAVPIPGSIVVVTGLALEHWTKGFFRAAPHRVLNPTNEDEAKKARQSLVYFHGVDEEAIIHPIEIQLKSWAPIKEFSSEPKSASEIAFGPTVDAFKGYAQY